jgi:hypothetical protein
MTVSANKICESGNWRNEVAVVFLQITRSRTVIERQKCAIKVGFNCKNNTMSD